MGLFDSLKHITSAQKAGAPALHQKAVMPAVNIERATGINPFGLGNLRLDLPEDDSSQLMKLAYKGNHLVYTVVDWKASKMAQPKPLLYQVKNQSKFAKYKSYNPAQRLDSYSLKAAAVTEIDSPTHPVNELLRRPNALQTWSQLMYELSVYYDFGECLILGNRLTEGMDKGKVLELYSLPTGVYTGVNPTVNGYATYMRQDDAATSIPGENVLHVARFDPLKGMSWGTLRGMSKLTPARALLAKSTGAVEAEAELMQNRGGRVFVFPKGQNFDVQADSVMAKKSVEEARRRLKQTAYGGMVGMPFEMGMLQIGMSAVDLELIESNRLTKEDWAALWHVKSISVFSSSEGTTYANLEEANKASLTDGVLPDLNLLYEKLNSWLLPAYGDDLYIEPDTDCFRELQANKKDIASWADSVPMTGDERRQLFGWGATGQPEMQIPLIKSGLVPVSDFAAVAGGNPPNDGSYA